MAMMDLFAHWKSQPILELLLRTLHNFPVMKGAAMETLTGLYWWRELEEDEEMETLYEAGYRYA